MLNTIFFSSLIPILSVGGVSIHVWSLFLFALIIKKNLWKINKTDLIFYSFGLMSLLINLNVSILYFLVIIFITQRVRVSFDTRIIKLTFYIIVIIYLYIFIFNITGISLTNKRLAFFNNNAFNAGLFVYILIYMKIFKYSNFVGYPVLALFMNRGAILGMIIHHIIKFFKINSSKINIISVIALILLQASSSIILNTIEFEHYYFNDIRRMVTFQGSSSFDRLSQYAYFFNNIDMISLFTNTMTSFNETTLVMQVPHSSIITTLSKGGIFFYVFLYGIAAVNVRSSVFLPVIVTSFFLHSLFLPHILIIIEKAICYVELRSLSQSLSPNKRYLIGHPKKI